MKKMYPDSKVEVQGFEAKHYDFFMNFLTLGLYVPFIHSAIKNLKIKKGMRILVLGAGTGRNTCLMRNYLKDTGQIIAYEIGEQMRANFTKRCSRYSNIILKNQRIDVETKPEKLFDKAFISFVLHGLPHENRLTVIKNVFNHLKPKGVFHILDYNEFDPDKKAIGAKLLKKFECPYAMDYVKRDWKQILTKAGFTQFEEKKYFTNYVRLLSATKA